MSDRPDPPRTIVSPMPGGRRPEAPAGDHVPPPPGGLGGGYGGGGGGFDLSGVRPGVNPLVAAGAEQEVVDVARYALAATIDDAVLNKPWGIERGYQHATLVGSSHSDVQGGERFFDYFAAAERNLTRYGDLVELMYICVSLGFQGVYRLRGMDGRDSLHERRARAFEAVRTRRGGFAETLSLQWRGVETERKPLRELLPTWLVAAVSVAVCAGLFVAFVWQAGGAAGTAVAAVAQMPPQGLVRIVALDPPPPTPPAPPPAPPQTERVSKFLQTEIDERIVEVIPEAEGLRIRLTGDGMFQLGSASLERRFQETLGKVAAALNGEDVDA